MFSDALTAWAIGVAFVGAAALYVLPTNRHRARLGARVASTLSLLAVVPSFLLRFFDLGSNGGRAAAAVTLGSIVLIFLGVNYFVNRRRARRSSRASRGVAA